MACLLRAVSRTGTELMVKNSSLIPRSLPGVSAASLQQSRCLSSEEKAAQKAAKKAEVQAALDKKMREKYGIVTHDDCVSDMTKWETVPVATHTAAAWDDSDNKNARFIDGHKLTVKMHAIDLIAEIPPIASEDRVVSCDGGGGALGHPKVFINLDKPGNHSCGYCGLRFFLDHHH